MVGERVQRDQQVWGCQKGTPSPYTFEWTLSDIAHRPGSRAKLGGINLPYERLTTSEVHQAIVGLHNTDLALYEKLSTPSLSTPMPPPPPEHNGFYPEDQECKDDKMFVDSSLSIDEVVTCMVNGAPGEIAIGDSSDDKDINGFGHDNSDGPAHALEPFDTQFTTSPWMWWDGTG